MIKFRLSDLHDHGGTETWILPTTDAFGNGTLVGFMALKDFVGQVRVIGKRAKCKEGLESASKDGSGLWDQSVLKQKYARLS